tara:strand:- start:450 stop:1187 length:738 start_codon:yes stop_codon:yes gene_type:complete
MTFNIGPSKGPVFFESFVTSIVSPLQKFFSQTVNWVKEYSDHYFFLANVSGKNKRLQAEINRLVRKNNELRERLLQEERLDKLLGTEEFNSNHILGNVIARDATQWSRVVFIDKGTNDGVDENVAIASNLGVIGHVIQAGNTSSKVLLINDSRSAVDALFQGSRVFGVVAGTGGDVCKMKYVPLEADVKVGDKVISSGLGGVFPKGWMVGTVSKVVRRKQGLFQEITVQPSADLNRLEEVLVLLP